MRKDVEMARMASTNARVLQSTVNERLMITKGGSICSLLVGWCKCATAP
jgi:hypothetical protein